MNATIMIGGVLLLILWGTYGVVGKLAVQQIGLQVLLWSPVAWLILLPTFFVIFKDLTPIKFDGGAVWALGAGLLGVSGTVVFYWLLRGAPASIVTPISALYPVVTVALAFIFLHEELSPTRLAGIGLAVIAIWLIST